MHMKSLYEFINEDLTQDHSQINENLFRSSAAALLMRRKDPEYLLNGILDMYETICEGNPGSDEFKKTIKLFYDGFPLLERPLWKALYKLYENKVWSIFDISKINFDSYSIAGDSNNDNQSGDESEFKDCFDEENELIKVTPEFRRQLRRMIQQSKNSKLDLSANDIDMIMLIQDPQFDQSYVFTINKIPGFFRKAFNLTDRKMLEKVFEKISNNIQH